MHDVLTFELIVIASAFLAVFGYLRASAINRKEREQEHQSDSDNGDNDALLQSDNGD